MDQVQRRDIDTALERVSLGIDEENVAQSPYQFVVTSFVGNNWIKDGDAFRKYSLAEDDRITFPVEPITQLNYKNITKILIGFDYDVSTKCELSNVSMSCNEQTLYESVETVINGQGHIDVDCSLFGFSNDVVNTAITEQGFSIGLNFNGVKSNSSVRLTNVTLSLEFTNKLQEEMDAVANRLSANFDVYVEDTDLVFDFLGTGGSASGGGSSGGVDVDTVNRLIASALGRLGINSELTLMNNGYIKLDIDIDDGDGV